MYKKILRCEDELWEEYVRLWKEVKQLVTEKKLQFWNEVVDKVKSDYEGSKKEFWAFVGRRTKGKKKGIVALRHSAFVSVTSIRESWRYLRCIMDTKVNAVWIVLLIIVGKRR